MVDVGFAGRGDLGYGGCRTACFSFAAYARSVVQHLRRCGVRVAKGLTEEETVAIESRLSFTFPPDLRSVLQEGLPIGPGFPDWRSPDADQTLLESPTLGLSHTRFWFKPWGPCPPHNLEPAVVRSFLASPSLPRLIPIFRHCYIPATPSTAGNPVFFIHCTDVFYCGYDLADFFAREPFPPGISIGLALETPVPQVRNGEKKKGGGGRGGIVSRYSYFHPPLSAKALSQFTLPAPPWAACAARHIHFWSDLAEETANVIALAPHSMKSPAPPPPLPPPHPSRQIRLSRYFRDVAARLRDGGWEEDDIREMTAPTSTPHLCVNPTSLLVETIASSVDGLSNSLRMAGWSAADVFEALDFDTLLKQKK